MSTIGKSIGIVNGKRLLGTRGSRVGGSLLTGTEFLFGAMEILWK